MPVTALELLALPVPDRPAHFTPFHAPPGWATDFESFLWHDGSAWWPHRPIIRPIMWVAHTNGATREGSTRSQINWANAGVQSHTHPHYSLNYPTPTKFVPSDRRSIANSSTLSWELAHGTVDASFWTGSIETRDPGWPVPGHAGGFMDDEPIHDAEMVARVMAFESVLAHVDGWVDGGIPPVYPDTYGEPGMVTHTEPWPYPALTIQRGKVCPGDTKKLEFRTAILPRVALLMAAWMPSEPVDPFPPLPPPPPPEEPDTMKPTHLINYRGLGVYYPDTGIAVSGATYAYLTRPIADGGLGVPVIEDDHDEFFATILEANGPTHALRLGMRAVKNEVDIPGIEDDWDDTATG